MNKSFISFCLLASLAIANEYHSQHFLDMEAIENSKFANKASFEELLAVKNIFSNIDTNKIVDGLDEKHLLFINITNEPYSKVLSIASEMKARGYENLSTITDSKENYLLIKTYPANKNNTKIINREAKRLAKDNYKAEVKLINLDIYTTTNLDPDYDKVFATQLALENVLSENDRLKKENNVLKEKNEKPVIKYREKIVYKALKKEKCADFLKSNYTYDTDKNILQKDDNVITIPYVLDADCIISSIDVKGKKIIFNEGEFVGVLKTPANQISVKELFYDPIQGTQTAPNIKKAETAKPSVKNENNPNDNINTTNTNIDKQEQSEAPAPSRIENANTKSSSGNKFMCDFSKIRTYINNDGSTSPIPDVYKDRNVSLSSKVEDTGVLVVSTEFQAIKISHKNFDRNCKPQ